MPVSASTVQFSYVGDGVTTTFPFPSRFLTAADLLVGVNGAQIVSGFTVTGAGNDAGGNVVFSVAPVNGAAITLIRAPAISQLLDFVNNQTVLAENIDNGLDKLTIVAQYLSYLLDRTLKLSQFDTGLAGDYDLMLKRLTNMAAPVDANDAARLVDLQSVVAGSGNVPLPTVGQIGFVLKAISTGVFGWIAAGSPTAPDGSLAAPGYSFASELNTGFLRPSAGVLQAAILGVLKAELTASQFRLLVPLVQSMATAVTAGTNAQGQGALTNSLNVVTATAANPAGVTLPTPVAGQSIRVVNRGTNPINLYPAVGGTIGALAINTPLLIPVGVAVDLFARTTAQWEGYAPQPRSAALDGITTNGGVTTADLTAATLVTAAETIAANNTDTALPTSAAVKAYVDATSFVKAWGNINTASSSGTYTRAGTLVTVTLAGHGMTTGQSVYLDFTTGTATDGYYAVTVIDANTFTVTDAASGSTSGNVTRNAWVRAGSNIASLTRGTGTLVVTFTTPMSDANYACVITTGNLNSLPSAGAHVGWVYAYATGSVSIGISDNNTDTGTNSEALNFVVYR